MMSKKDFIALADSITTGHAHFTAEHLEVLAGFCQSRNGRFKRERWLNYIAGLCGPNGGEVTQRAINKRYARKAAC